MSVIDIQGLIIGVLLIIAVFGLIARSNQIDDAKRLKRIFVHELKYAGQKIPATFDIR